MPAAKVVLELSRVHCSCFLSMHKLTQGLQTTDGTYRITSFSRWLLRQHPGLTLFVFELSSL